MKTKRLAWLPLSVSVLATGCAAPTFEQPSIDVPPQYREAQLPVQTEWPGIEGTRWKPAAPAAPQAAGQWWLAFNDAILTALIKEATDNNPVLTVAAARVVQARSIAVAVEADEIPQIAIGVGTERSRQDRSLGQLSNSSLTQQTINSAGFRASYEVDLFGRVSAGTLAAKGDAESAAATFRAVLLTLQSDVAMAYFRLRTIDCELETVAQTVRLREESVAVTQRRFDLGDIGEFDLSRAKTELATARADAIGLQRQRALTEHALAVLLGKAPARYSAKPSPLVDTGDLPSIPAGLPSSLLERRPDIVAAQRAMEAANARIGMARSAVFPALTINATAGGAAGTFSDVFKWSSRAWVVGALLSAPLVDGGRNQANIRRAEGALAESVANYRQSVLIAFSEVEDQLASLRILAGQAQELEAALVSARRSADLAQKLYDAGRSSYFELLDVQRNLATVERTAVQLRGSRAVATVSLVKALGGGWEVLPAGQNIAAR
ncbi:efflux transporter outer membrane subunit [Massilia sp. IC2-477]|uniref:efflux transporter outer membrane subunit n=1 Tax=Massilia sp. IC2-477 TaxID=2887198 RepID=UPI001D0FE009|nr:efflux transporter outer membrane subunit [Massilia sp. IC2-477]MCC2954348.1 efflux transporter outer membrane subunit [Massilia sp. IC2-477]